MQQRRMFVSWMHKSSKMNNKKCGHMCWTIQTEHSIGKTIIQSIDGIVTNMFSERISDGISLNEVFLKYLLYG